jgi:hypothetical protein
MDQLILMVSAQSISWGQNNESVYDNVMLTMKPFASIIVYIYSKHERRLNNE